MSAAGAQVPGWLAAWASEFTDSAGICRRDRGFSVVRRAILSARHRVLESHLDRRYLEPVEGDRAAPGAALRLREFAGLRWSVLRPTRALSDAGQPGTQRAIDNLPYRAKRILFCWVAWAAGLGQPAWIVQAHALLNVFCWLALGWVLLHWFPPTSWQNLVRWTAVMFSHGVCMSVRHSLVDGPSLLLVALALRWLENGRRGAGVTMLSLAGLGKETSLLACAGLDFNWRSRAPGGARR